MENGTDSEVAQPKTVAIQSPTATTTQSPSKRPIMITQGQKQALIDNLQLEITERARKLRAQYALQAQSLRTRIELRVNRIPTAMRKANMGELYEKYLESIKKPLEPKANQTAPQIKAPKQQQSPAKTTANSPSKPAPPSHGIKRPSDHFSADDDKENTPDPTHPLSSKKRPKPNNHPSNPSTILSPKSSNTRNMAPQSPIHAQLGSPQKSHLSHPTSPLKPSGGYPAVKQPSPAKAAAVGATTAASAAITASEKPRATRTRAAAAAAKPAKAPASKAKAAPNTRAKRCVEAPVEVPKHELRTVSAASNASTGTTVVRKVGRGAGTGVAAAAKGKGKGTGGKGVGRKGAAAVEGPPQGRRVLRKRG
ncbi:MAG: hypothetical protein Q9225_005171 [Loekoesia sp. 1 TL-2023]